MSDTKKVRTLIGKVTSNKMDKTIVVSIIRRVKHPRYRKIIKKITRLHVHDAENECNIGDTVCICEARPFSKTKAWKLVSIIE